MKVWQKALIIFVGGGISAVCAYLIPIHPEWVTALGALQVADLAIVAIITGYRPTV